MNEAFDDPTRGSAPRPWPAPRRPWAIRMRWLDLLFAHWPVAPAALRPRVPEALELDVRDGTAWLGIVPFVMTAVRRRGLPPIPFASTFPELNVRTYVTHGGKPGVWFLSLDAGSALAVLVARATFHLPYFRARMSAEREGDSVRYRSVRTHGGAPPAAIDASYRASGAPFTAADGSIEEFLTSRYCLYAADRKGGIHRGEIHHAPWPLQKADSVFRTNGYAAAHGLEIAGPPLLHFATKLDVAAWPLERVDAGS
jgi:uncharacterized protein YqjF (DUF2071 family)